MQLIIGIRQCVFYDDYGSKLFEEITKLNEYYPTKTELGILEKQKKLINEWNQK